MGAKRRVAGTHGNGTEYRISHCTCVVWYDMEKGKKGKLVCGCHSNTHFLLNEMRKLQTMCHTVDQTYVRICDMAQRPETRRLCEGFDGGRVCV